jgi:hypothetical protein
MFGEKSARNLRGRPPLGPLREHLTSSHEKSPLIACPNRGRRVAPEKPAGR